MKKGLSTNSSTLQQTLYALGCAGFNIMERLVVLYVPFFFLPPAEYGVHNLLPQGTFFGFLTVLGSALVVGRVFDGLADPIIASLSDNSRSPLGRRKIFMLFSGLPLAVFGALIFFPAHSHETSLLNGLWLGSALCLFYIAYTGYVNPYLALISDLGDTEDLRLKLSTKLALFGLVATLAVLAGFPEMLAWLLKTGATLRTAFQTSVVVFCVVAAVLLYVANFGFTEKPINRQPETVGTWTSLKETYRHKRFRTFVMGEMLLQYGINISTMGLLYYVVVIFQKPEGYMTVVALAIATVGLVAFPAVNYCARRFGKRAVLIAGVCVLIVCCGSLFLMSFFMGGIWVHLALLALALSGVPLAVLAILINPSIAEMAREHTLETGVSREAMFFAARAIPVKFIVALAGATFGFLLSVFGKDIGRPLGVQLSLLVIALAGVGSLLCFLRLPEDRPAA
jgi:GPH family glycoside/pentoside/hexuronide:cation symporter